MKLNHDCVRSLLIHIEQNVHYGEYLDVNQASFDEFTEEELIYAADKLLEANYVDGEKHKYVCVDYPNITIKSITWEGHKFLDNIRDDGVWKKTKNILSKFSSASLSLTSNIAAQVIATIIQNQIGLS